MLESESKSNHLNKVNHNECESMWIVDGSIFFIQQDSRRLGRFRIIFV